MENFEIDKSVQLVKEKKVILSKLTLDSNNKILVDGEPVSSRNLVFDTLTELETFANSSADNIGQVCGVANTTDNTVKIYQINIDKTVSEINTGSTPIDLNTLPTF